MQLSRSLRVVAALGLLAKQLVSALDVEVTGSECDQSLPITADFTVTCDGKKRCTFGESTAHVAGTFTYNGLYQSGMENNVGYMSTDVELMTLKYNFQDMMPVPLCSESLQAGENNQGDCPADGTYAFAVSYDLPSAGDQSTSWLASGWAGSGVIRMYAEEDESMMIGECTFNLKTYVTPTAEKGFLQTPSAAATVGIVLGALAAVALVCLWCYCCARKKKQQKKVTESPEDAKSITKDDLSTFFKRLDEDNKSRMSATSPTYYQGASVATGSLYPASVMPPTTVTASPQTAAPDGELGSGYSTVSGLASGDGAEQKKSWFSRIGKGKETSSGAGGSLLSKFGRKRKTGDEGLEEP